MKFIRHLLICGFVLSTCFALADDAKQPKVAPTREVKAYKNVGVEAFDQLRSNKNNVVLDVRTAKEFQSGHIPGAVNVDWNSADFEKKVAGLDKNKTYLVHCAVGGRSAKASDKLTGLHFKSIYNLEGGMKAWEKAGKPVEK